jgi:hypothetical protein
MKPLALSLTNKPHIKIMNITKKSKPLTGAEKRKQKRELQEREEREQRELVADIERLKLGPTDLWKLITEYPDIFETHVLLSGYLNDSDIKMFYECCRASRSAVIRAKIELQVTFCVDEFSSISTLELAWEGFPWGERRRDPSGNFSAVESLKRTISNYSDGFEKRRNVLGIGGRVVRQHSKLISTC